MNIPLGLGVYSFALYRNPHCAIVARFCGATCKDSSLVNIYMNRIKFGRRNSESICWVIRPCRGVWKFVGNLEVCKLVGSLQE
jgi:hypothetical protein